MAKIEQSIDVEVPVRTAYNQLTQFEDYPRFMDSVREIKQDDAAHLHWRAEKGGKEIEWDSEITEQVPDKVIAWRNTSGAKNIGRVVFQTTSADRTRVTISIDTDEAATGETGKASKQRLERDLQKFKAFIEAEGVETGAWRGAIEGGEEVSSQRQSNAIGQNGHSSSSNGNGTNFGARNVAQVQLNTDDAQGRQPRQPAGQSSFKSEANMANQGGSMQFSGEVNQSRSSAQQPTSSPLAQAWAQPARIMSQMSSAFGQMPARMLEQEANLLQNSFVSP